MSKDESFYREADNVHRNCMNCVFMMDDGTCDLVSVRPKEGMVCNLWSQGGTFRSWQ